MAGFFTRTKHLDKHIAHRLRTQAHAITKADVLDIDAPVLYEMAKMFARSADTPSILEWYNQQDTAFREMVPMSVDMILKDNTYD